MDFADQIAIVTGAARGVGKEIARRFVQSGAFTILIDIDLKETEQVAQQLNEGGPHAQAFRSDVSKIHEVEKVFNQVIDQYGRIDILVNNAAVFAESVLIMDIEDQEWDRVLNTNLKGVFNCSKAVIRQMIKQKSGRIINLTSFVGKTGRVVYSKVGTPTKAHYCASKAGIISLTRSLAYELAPHNINVNAVAPGSIATEATDKEKRGMITPLVPLGRMGGVDDVAAAVLFLASPDASFITGETININGGTLMD
ncbi:MAG: SDR family oxidoreductase [Deltaproteobacteria bacterium]|nr:SDR family oxidoreductase [Deltaproteobacteria bacterium]MBW2136711.1 SDR family oxidoreductase [Deltaproteobacteria bacterium]